MKHDECYGFLIDRIDSSDLRRWKKKARRCFTSKNNTYAEQGIRAVDLARDIYRVLDPVGFNGKS